MRSRETRQQGKSVDDCSIIALDKFIQATRDSGYAGTASAVSELVDNSIQAGAKRIAISITQDVEDRGLLVSVLDDGCGMDPFTLQQALRFGGSTRFNDRCGLGRYGMGLPNASLSQARHLEVISWQTERGPRKADRQRKAYRSYLDVDAIVRGEIIDVPRPVVTRGLPRECESPSGTMIVWSRCDRLDNRRISTLVRKIAAELGRRFRHYLWSSLHITINKQPIQAVDPLCLHPDAAVHGASEFGSELRREVRVHPDDPKVVGVVRIRFSELPVREWHALTNDEKRRRGISKGAGVSIVRAGREVDSGWFFMGTKHRENYDDWWRCEVQFDPILDEAFGITHTKQQVRPTAELLEALTPDIEAIARVLNGRARRAHLAAKEAGQASEAERTANSRERFLRRLPKKPKPKAKALMADLAREGLVVESSHNAGPLRYQIVERPIRGTQFYTYAYDGRQLALVVNRDHPFYREVYKPLLELQDGQSKRIRVGLELMLIAAVRAEAALDEEQPELSRFRLEWSDTLATLLND